MLILSDLITKKKEFKVVNDRIQKHEELIAHDKKKAEVIQGEINSITMKHRDGIDQRVARINLGALNNNPHRIRAVMGVGLSVVIEKHSGATATTANTVANSIVSEVIWVIKPSEKGFYLDPEESKIPEPDVQDFLMGKYSAIMQMLR